MLATMRTATVGIVVLILGLLPATSDAQHRGAHASPHHFQHRPFAGRSVIVGPFVPFGYSATSIVVYSAPPVYYAPPPVVYAPPMYAAAPAYAPPPAAAYGPPPPPSSAPPLQQDVEPLKREVVFPSGRYVLRGDGVAMPYTWVWIPNPPAAPPGAAPSSLRRPAHVYSWTDANGVTTWTDRLSSVPVQYRSGAQREP